MIRRTPRRRAARAIALTLAACLTTGLVARGAAAAPPPGNAGNAPSGDEAGAHFRRGVELFKEADFRAALIEFRRAYQLSPNYRVLYNMGQCYLELQDYAGALRSFEKYVADGGAQIPRERRTAVEAEIQKLQPRVAHLEVSTNVVGAEVRVDDDVVGTTPLGAPLLVSAGRRRVAIEKAGMPTAVKIVDLAGGDRLAVSVPVNEPRPTPAPAPAPVAAPAPPPSAPPMASHVTSDTPAEAKHSYTWVAWTVTGVLAAGAVATGVLAVRAKSDLDAHLDTFPGDPVAIDDARHRAQTFALVTDILGGAAVVAGGVSLYVTLAHGHGSDGARAAWAPSPSWRLGVGPGRVGVEGRF